MRCLQQNSPSMVRGSWPRPEQEGRESTAWIARVRGRPACVGLLGRVSSCHTSLCRCLELLLNIILANQTH